MIATAPYHDVSHLYREPGGFQFLDACIQKIRQWFPDRQPASIRILDLGAGSGGVSLPLAFLGYNVTAIDRDENQLRRCAEAAQDLKLRIRILPGDLQTIQHDLFDIILVQDQSQTTLEAIPTLITHLEVHGCLLLDSDQSFSHLKKNLPLWHNQGLTVHDLTPLRRRSKSRKSLRKHQSQRHSARQAAPDRFISQLISLAPDRCFQRFLLQFRRSDPTKIPVLHLIPTLAEGGAEHLIAQLVKQLPEHKYAPIIVGLFGHGHLADELRAAQLPVHLTHATSSWDLRLFFRLRRILFLEQPRLIHTHLFGADLWGRLVAWSLGMKPILSTAHNTDPDRSAFKNFLLKLTEKVTQATVAISQEVKKSLIAQGVPAAKIHLIYNGIDDRRVIQRRPHGFHDIPRLITVGRLTPQKDQATLLHALAPIRRPWTLDIAGSGENEADLKRLAEDLGISPRLRWLGFCQDVPARLAESDLFCFSSRWEGFGVALVEAAAAGLPILASDIPVFHEILPQGLFSAAPAMDIPAWTHHIESILKDPQAALRRAQKAREYVLEHFTLSTMTTAYTNLYDHLTHQ